jgi:hypothetical protein
MTKLTREQLFYEAFGMFMENNMSNIYYEITANTTNKQNKIQNYMITLPHSVAIGVHDQTVDGIRQENNLYNDQWIPSSDHMTEEFHNYFDQYSLHAAPETGIRLSYMLIRPYNAASGEGEGEEEEEEGDQPICKYKITIVYYKTHKPFPVANPKSSLGTELNSEIVELKSIIRMMDETIYNYHQRIYRVRDVLHDERVRRKQISENLHTTIYNNHSRMEKHIRGMFDSLKIEQDCPVCYEQITSETLVVPSCCHYICNACIPKCPSCPICRETYNNYVLSTHITNKN